MKSLAVKNISFEYNTRLSGFGAGKNCYVASVDGKLKMRHVACPQCGQATCVENGYHAVEDSLVKSLGLRIHIAQFWCKKCGVFWSSERELLDRVIFGFKDFIKSLLLGCARQGLSFESASALVKEKIGKTYSSQYVYELYVEALCQVRRDKFVTASGVYHYDEQFLLVNGIEACRLVIKDAVTNKVIIDMYTPDAQKETIKRVLRTALKGLPVDAFVVDMNPHYPEIFHELFPKAKIQWCIFHLHKIIWKELRDEFGKTIPLQQLYNAYLLFNIFFNHEPELEKLKELLKKIDWYTGKAALPEFHSGDFPSPSLIEGDRKSVFQTRAAPQEEQQIEKCLRQEFAEFVKHLKNTRRRKHENIPRRTLHESEEIFTQIKQQSSLYPKKLQKRIQYIDENWDKLTLFQRDSRVPPTNNGLEHYFAATLAKTEKKDFRSKAAITRELTTCQEEWNGHRIFSTTKLIEMLHLIGLLFLAFPPT